jgi:hypothetical protein
VNAHVRHLAQPSPDRQVRRLAVDNQSFLGQPTGERHVEALPQVADEPFDLALGLRAIRCAQPGPETAVTGKVEKARMKAVSTPAVAVPLQHDRAHIVVEHLARHAAEGEERILMRLDQRFDPLVGDELDIGGPAPAKRRDEYRKPVVAAPDDRPVDLHLFAGIGLEADHRLRCCRRLQRRHEHLQHRVAAGITALAQLAQQHRRRYPFRRCRAQSFDHVEFERVKLPQPGRARLVARRLLVAQIASHRVARDTRFPRDLADAPAMPMQYPDLQSRLLSNHPAPSQSRKPA